MDPNEEPENEEPEPVDPREVLFNYLTSPEDLSPEDNALAEKMAQRVHAIETAIEAAIPDWATAEEVTAVMTKMALDLAVEAALKRLEKASADSQEDA